MPSFKGSEKIIIQPFDQMTYGPFVITSCSAIDANDGFLPYNRTTISAIVSAYQEDKTTLANDMINGTPQVITGDVYVPMRYPQAGTGRYSLRFILTLDNGDIKEADFNRVEAEDL